VEDAVALPADSGVEAELTLRVRSVDHVGAVLPRAERDRRIADDEPTGEVERVVTSKLTCEGIGGGSGVGEIALKKLP